MSRTGLSFSSNFNRCYRCHQQLLLFNNICPHCQADNRKFKIYDILGLGLTVLSFIAVIPLFMTNIFRILIPADLIPSLQPLVNNLESFYVQYSGLVFLAVFPFTLIIIVVLNLISTIKKIKLFKNEIKK